VSIGGFSREELCGFYRIQKILIVKITVFRITKAKFFGG